MLEPLSNTLLGESWKPGPLEEFRTFAIPPSPANVSQLLRHMIEEHQSNSPDEELVKCSSSGNLGRVEELVRAGHVAIDNQYNGHTALQAASQVSLINILDGSVYLRCPIHRMDTLIL